MLNAPGTGVSAAPFSSLSESDFAASVPNVNLEESSVTPSPERTSVPSESVVLSTREEVNASVPGPVFSIAPDVAALIVADTPFDTATSPTESAAEPVIVALARNVTDAAVTSESTAAASPEFSNTAAVELNQLPGTPFFAQWPAVSHDAPDAPPFHTYSPASVSAIAIFVPLSASTRA